MCYQNKIIEKNCTIKEIKAARRGRLDMLASIFSVACGCDKVL